MGSAYHWLPGAEVLSPTLTPDASDRRDFRILVPDSPSIVLSLYAAPFDVTTLPFVNVATLLAKSTACVRKAAKAGIKGKPFDEAGTARINRRLAESWPEIRRRLLAVMLPVTAWVEDSLLSEEP